MTQVATMIDHLRAERLLEGSYLLAQIADLRSSLFLPSEGRALNYDDYFDYLLREAERVPTITLLERIPAQQESSYSVQLVEALDRVQDRIDFLLNKIVAFRSRLTEVQSSIEETGASFETWYHLAVTEYLGSRDIKLPAQTLKSLASSEFKRLAGGAPVSIASLLAALGAESKRLEAKKKMAQRKFDLGREQVNASYHAALSGHFGHSSEGNSLRLISEAEPGEEEAPTFVSRRQRVATLENDHLEADGASPEIDADSSPDSFTDSSTDSIVWNSIIRDSIIRDSDRDSGEGEPEPAFLMERHLPEAVEKAVEKCLEVPDDTVPALEAAIASPLTNPAIPFHDQVVEQTPETVKEQTAEPSLPEEERTETLPDVISSPPVQPEKRDGRHPAFVKHGAPVAAHVLGAVSEYASFEDHSDDDEDARLLEEIQESASDSGDSSEIPVSRREESPLIHNGRRAETDEARDSPLPVPKTLVAVRDDFDELDMLLTAPPRSTPKADPQPVIPVESPTPAIVRAPRKTLVFKYDDDIS